MNHWMRHRTEVVVALFGLTVWAAPNPLSAQTERFNAGPLERVSSCVGGVWVAREKQTDGAGREFIPIRTCEWAAGGVALYQRQEYLYEDGAVRPGTEGLLVWDHARATVRAFGVFAHGGVIFDATYRAESLDTATHVMEFRYASPQGGVTSWRSVETWIDENTYTEEGLMLADGQWESMSLLTFHRLARLNGAGTYRDMAGNGPTGRP